MADYTTTALLSSIKTRGLIPTSDLTFSDTDILAMATEELKLGVVPFLLKHRSNYLSTSSDTALVSGTANYSIPSRAIGGKVNQLSLVDSAGNIYPFPQIEKNELPLFNNPGSNQYVFYFEGNDVVVVPTPTSASYSIRFTYYSRPNNLVSTSSVAIISSINTVANTVTVSSLPSTITTGVTVDLVKAKPGFDFRAVDQAISNIASTTITLTSTLPASLVVGDYVCLAEESPVPQIPADLHPMLAQRTTVKLLEALGDEQGTRTAQAKLKELEEAASHLISPRTDGNPKKLINRYNPLRCR